MENKIEILIKYYNMEEKRYDLSYQKILSLTINELKDLVNELPPSNYILPISLKSESFNLVKLENDEIKYSFYDKNFKIEKEKKIKISKFIDILKIVQKDPKKISLEEDVYLQKQKSKKYDLLYGETIIPILWALLFLFSLIGLYGSALDLFKEAYTLFNHLIFIIFISIAFIYCLYPISDLIKRRKKRKIFYEIIAIDDFKSYDISKHLFRLLSIIGLAYAICFATIIIVNLAANIIAFLLISTIFGSPSIYSIIANYNNNKRHKIKIINLLKVYQFEKSNTFEEKLYYLKNLIEINKIKPVQIKYIPIIITAIPFVLSFFTPFF